MDSSAVPQVSEGHYDNNHYSRTRLYIVSCMAMAMAGINFSMRSSAAGGLQKAFLDPFDPIHAAGLVATILGIPFLGFALTIAIASPIVDYFGMRRLLPLSAICFSAGMLTMMFADRFAYGAGIYTVLWIGALITGIGWGLVETVVNPLIAVLYPNKKTGKLNALHAWWPGGIAIGSLLAAGTSNIHLGWQWKLAVVCIPAIGVIALCRGLKFPSAERAESRGSIGELFSELASPLFVILFLSMMLTAIAEFAPGQWLDVTWTRTLHMEGIWLPIYLSGLMFVMRHFAGVLEHWLSPLGVLCLSCVLASIGLLILSAGATPSMGLVGATLWGTGICFLWPTMLAAASEKVPRGGATLFGLMETAGTLSIQFILPSMCAIFNTTKVAAAGGEGRFNMLKDAELDRVFQVAAQTSFFAVAILPALLVLVFGGIWYYDKTKGG